MNISAGEFANMTEKERVVLTYEMMTNIDKQLEHLSKVLEELKKCIEEGKITDNDNSNDIAKAQSTGDEGLKTAKAAHKRIDKMVWAVAGTAVGALIAILIAMVTNLIHKGAG